jgi:serine-type D-Ala-D-Ala carboxypeptidase/endopeptidase
MQKTFQRVLLCEGLLFVVYLVCGFTTADRLPREVIDWVEADAMGRPATVGIYAIISLVVVVFPVALTALSRSKAIGRILFLWVLPPLVWALHMLEPVSIGDRWTSLLGTGLAVGYGLIVGLLLSADGSAALPSKPPSLPAPQPGRGRRVALWVAGGIAVLVVDFFGLCLVIIKVLPQPASEDLVVAKLAPIDVDSTPEVLEQALGTLADRFMENAHNKGIAIGVTRGAHRSIVTRGVGVNENSLFEIGSISKTFTGLVLADSVERKVVKLEQPIHTLLANSAEPILAEGQPVTLLDLATHRSGFPRLSDNLGLLQRLSGRPYAGFTEADMLNAIGRTKPGKREFAYSNFGMTVLAHLLARGNGKPFPELQQDVCTRLELTNTWIQLPESERGRLLTAHSWGLETPHWFDSGLFIDGAGSTLSSPAEMLNYLELCLHPDESGLPEAISMAIERQRAGARKGRSIGLAWHRNEDEKLNPIIWHNGATGGFCAYAGFAPKHNVGVVVLCNSGDMAVSDLGQQILEALAGRR